MRNGGARPPQLILVLEDVEETRDGIERLLKKDGYRILSARSEDEAARKGKQDLPDLLLVGLPGSDAQVIAAASRARDRAGRTLETPIIVFSANSIDEGAELESGENIHLIRPDNFDHLREFIRRILDR